jgi:hypothetical protein
MHIAEQKEGKGLLTNAIKCERLVPKNAATPRCWCGQGALTCYIHTGNFTKFLCSKQGEVSLGGDPPPPVVLPLMPELCRSSSGMDPVQLLQISKKISRRLSPHENHLKPFHLGPKLGVCLWNRLRALFVGTLPAIN